MKSVAVFCGSNSGADPAFTKVAEEFSDCLLAQNLRLVYGGSNNGLMGTLANRVLAGGGEVIGVMPECLVQWEQAHTNLTELVTVKTMHERKQLMADYADGFIALPGGIGTLDEIFEAISWAQLGIHQKPCAFLNVNGYYDHLIRFLDHSVGQELTRPRIRSMILSDDQPSRLLQLMSDSVQFPLTTR